MRRRRPGSTTRSAVLDAALAVVDEVGLPALTIRAVATRVGAPPMTLYHHFANKDGLVDLMHAEVASRLCADAGQPTWRAEFISLCHQVRRILIDHPRWVPLISRPATLTSMPPRERLLTLLTADGMSATGASVAISNAGLIAAGLTLIELTYRDSEPRFDFSENFDVAIRAFVDGIAVSKRTLTAVDTPR